MARAGRRDEHFAGGPFCGSTPSETMKTIESKEVYRCKIFTVTHDKAVDVKTGFQIERSIVRHKGSAVMMAVDDARRILLVRQFRLPAGKSMWELPAGKVDDGEKPLQAARRELAE